MQKKFKIEINDTGKKVCVLSIRL